MKYEDLSFTTVNEDGVEVICDITMIIPNSKNSEEPYVMYTDYTLDNNDEFVEKYGKIMNVEGDYVLKTITEESIIDEIKKEADDEIVKYVNKEVQDNLE